MSSSSFEPDVLTVVGNETKSVLIGNLRKYVIYQIQVLAYTRMGDGELSQPPVSQQTLDDGTSQLLFYCVNFPSVVDKCLLNFPPFA